jgi:hypothetical protein
MKPTYETITNALGTDLIKRTDADGKESYIPIDPSNSDYQAYLNKDEVKADEAKTK